jgi:hypothetical protein
MARRTTGRRPRTRGRAAGTAVAVGAAGLIAFSGPGTELAAELTATRTAVAAPAPAPAADPPVAVVDVPEPVIPVPVSPAPTVSVPRPRPVGLDLRPSVPVGVAPETEPRPDPCGGFVTPRRITPAVEPGPGTATVSWQADERTAVSGYRVRAVRQEWVTGAQPQPPERTAAQPGGCAPVAVSFDGLARGGTYVFWLEEEVQDSYSARWVQVGTSEPVAIG